MIKKTTGYYILNEQDEYKLSFVSSVTLMDDDGNVIEQKKYSEEGELIEIHTFLYSESGEVLTSRIEYLLNGTEDSTENIFDDKDQLIVSINSFYDGTTHYERNKYSDQGNKIETAVNNQNEELLWRIEFKYDDLSNLIQECEFDENGVELSKVLNEYKEKQVIKENIFVEDKLYSSVVYDLNEKEIVTAITTFDGAGQVTYKSIYLEKEEGSVVLFQIDGKELSENCFLRKTIYNKNDLIIFTSHITESSTEENEYVYDDIERVISEFYLYKDESGVQKSMYKNIYEII